MVVEHLVMPAPPPLQRMEWVTERVVAEVVGPREPDRHVGGDGNHEQEDDDPEPLACGCPSESLGGGHPDPAAPRHLHPSASNTPDASASTPDHFTATAAPNAIPAARRHGRRIGDGT